MEHPTVELIDKVKVPAKPWSQRIGTYLVCALIAVVAEVLYYTPFVRQILGDVHEEVERCYYRYQDHLPDYLTARK